MEKQILVTLVGQDGTVILMRELPISRVIDVGVIVHENKVYIYQDPMDRCGMRTLFPSEATFVCNGTQLLNLA